MVKKRGFDRIYNMIDSKPYLRHEDVPETKEIFINGFKRIGSEKSKLYLYRA